MHPELIWLKRKADAGLGALDVGSAWRVNDTSHLQSVL